MKAQNAKREHCELKRPANQHLQLFKLNGAEVKMFAHNNRHKKTQKPLAEFARWIKFSPPNENWAQRRVSAIKIRV